VGLDEKKIAAQSKIFKKS